MPARTPELALSDLLHTSTHTQKLTSPAVSWRMFRVVLLSLTAVAGYSYGSYATQADSVDLLSAETQIGSVRMASSSRRSSSSSSSSSRRSSAYGTPTNSYGSSSSYGSYGTYGTYGSYGSSRSRRSSSVILVGGSSQAPMRAAICCSSLLRLWQHLCHRTSGRGPAGRRHRKMRAPQPMQQIWTISRHDGPNHLRLWLIRRC